MNLWPLALYAAAIVVLVGGLAAVSALVGERHRDPATGEPFESGVVAIGQARFRMSAHFYLVAISFVIFDMEAAFLFAWAVAFRDTGWAGYLGALVFLGILVLALVYEWRLGVLDWTPKRDTRGS